jgi:hypothetical protein
VLPDIRSTSYSTATGSASQFRNRLACSASFLSKANVFSTFRNAGCGSWALRKVFSAEFP